MALLTVYAVCIDWIDHDEAYVVEVSGPEAIDYHLTPFDRDEQYALIEDPDA